MKSYSVIFIVSLGLLIFGCLPEPSYPAVESSPQHETMEIAEDIDNPAPGAMEGETEDIDAPAPGPMGDETEQIDAPAPSTMNDKANVEQEENTSNFSSEFIVLVFFCALQPEVYIMSLKKIQTA